jgi:hypothetical protein
MADDNFDPQAAFDALQQMGPGKEERIDADPYAPPPGRPNYISPLQRYRYVPDAPNEHSVRLDPFEQKHVYKMALQLATVFGPEVQPIPDAMYAVLPHAQKAAQLFVIVSRSEIKQVGSDRIAWPALQVVVKEIPLVKIICTADFGTDAFDAWQIIFWRDDINGYEKPITRGQNPIPIAMIVEFVSRYVASIPGL